MADEAGSLVLCGISHEALRDQANRAHFEGTNDWRFEVYFSNYSNRWRAMHSTQMPATKQAVS